MRVGVVGSRNYPNLAEVEQFVRNLAAKYPEATVVSGNAAGVDHEAEETARACMLHVRSFRPVRRGRVFHVVLVETGRFNETIRGEDNRPLAFKAFGQAAYYRNGLIVRDCERTGDQIVAFHYQASKGTQDTIDKARAVGVPVHVYHPR